MKTLFFVLSTIILGSLTADTPTLEEGVVVEETVQKSRVPKPSAVQLAPYACKEGAGLSINVRF